MSASPSNVVNTNRYNPHKNSLESSVMFKSKRFPRPKAGRERGVRDAASRVLVGHGQQSLAGPFPPLPVEFISGSPGRALLVI